MNQRPRRYASPAALRLGAPVLAYDLGREAYRLRLVGDRLGPVIRVDRRSDAVGDAQLGRRSADQRSAGIRLRIGPRGLGWSALIAAVALLIVLIGLGISEIPHKIPARIADAPHRTTTHAHHARATLASGTTAASARVPRIPQLHHAARRTGTSTHRAAGHRHHAAPSSPRHHRAAHRTAPVHRAASPPATSQGSRSSAPVQTSTETTPVQTTSTPVYTTPAPADSAPAGTGSAGGSRTTGGGSSGSSATGSGSSGSGTSSSGSGTSSSGSGTSGSGAGGSAPTGTSSSGGGTGVVSGGG